MYYLFSKPLGADFQHIHIEVKATDTHWSHPRKKGLPTGNNYHVDFTICLT
jgi:hypothetical protein